MFASELMEIYEEMFHVIRLVNIRIIVWKLYPYPEGL